MFPERCPLDQAQKGGGNSELARGRFCPIDVLSLPDSKFDLTRLIRSGKAPRLNKRCSIASQLSYEGAATVCAPLPLSTSVSMYCVPALCRMNVLLKIILLRGYN